MNPTLKQLVVVAAVLVFIGAPVFFYAFGDFPRRSTLKEAISVLTLLAFSLMLAQFFLARSNINVISLFSGHSIRTWPTALSRSS